MIDAPPLRILWFGSYATGPGYPRSETLIEGLRARGHVVHEVHAPLFDGAAQRVSVGAGGGLGATAWRQAAAAAKLALKWFRADDHDIAVVGAGGLVDALLLRFLQNVDRRPVVLDAFVPLYDTVVRDRGLASPTSLRARALQRLERVSGRVADLVLADTDAHAELLTEDLRVAREKVRVVPICQPDPGPPDVLPSAGGPLRALLVATYIPLHGVETVVEAARRLDPDEVDITIVGTGQLFDSIAPQAEGVSGLHLVPEFVPLDEVRRRLAASHVGLGVFGDTAKAARVVPLKAALVLASGRALVTRDSPAAREAFGSDAAVLVPPSDAEALAEALRALAADPDRVAQLASAGRGLYEQRFAPDAVAGAFLDAVEPLGQRSE